MFCCCHSDIRHLEYSLFRKVCSVTFYKSKQVEVLLQYFKVKANLALTNAHYKLYSNIGNVAMAAESVYRRNN